LFPFLVDGDKVDLFVLRPPSPRFIYRKEEFGIDLGDIGRDSFIIFGDESGKIRPDPAQNVLPSSFFDRRPVRKNVSEPEFEKLILDPIKPLPGFQRRIFGHRDFFFNNVQILENEQVFMETAFLDPGFVDDLSDPVFPESDRFQDGEIISGFPEFLSQDKVHLPGEKSLGLEDSMDDVLFQKARRIDLFQITRVPSGEGKVFEASVKRSSREELPDIKKRERFQKNLTGSPPEERRLLSQDFAFHHADARSAENQVNGDVLEILVPSGLKNRGDPFIRFGKVGEFVENDDRPRLDPFPAVPKKEAPIGKSRAFQEFVPIMLTDKIGEPLPVVAFVDSLGEEVDMGLLPDELFDEFGLADSTLAVDHDELGFFFQPGSLQRPDFPFSIDEAHYSLPAISLL
jgi:hypothetical protein